MQESKKANRELFAGIFALILSIIFFVCCLSITEIKNKISAFGNINILVYAATLVLFCVLFLFGMILLSKENKKKIVCSQNSEWKKIIFLILLLSMSIFSVCAIVLETNQVGGVTYKYGWHTQPVYLMLLVFAFEVIVIFFLYTKINVEKADWIVWGIFILLTIIVCYNMYTPNIYGRSEYVDWYHAHAYYNSIYNVYWGIPYTADTTSIYGHYALLFKLPMELFNGDFRGFILVMAVICAITILCAFFVIYQLVKNKFLCTIGAIAIVCPMLGMRGGLYWQLWPHRLIFPMIILLYTVYILRTQKQGWIWDGIAYGLCTLATLWNTETGMIVAVSYGAMRVSMMLSKKNVVYKKVMSVSILHAAGITVSLFGAYGIVNVYNLLKNSKPNTMTEFLIPLLSDSYMTDILHLDLPLFPCGYMIYILILLVGVAGGIASFRWFHREHTIVTWKTHAILFMCISALGRLVYYMNRPAYHNLDCSFISVIIMMLVLAEESLKFAKNKKWNNMKSVSMQKTVKYAIGTFCFIYVLAVANGTILLFSQNSFFKETFHNDEEVDQFAEAFAAYVPENTFGFGIGVPELYSWLGWNTQFYSMDFADIPVAPEVLDRLVVELQEKDVKQAVTSEHTLLSLEKLYTDTYQWFIDTYELDQSFDIRGESYKFFVRKDVIVNK